MALVQYVFCAFVTPYTRIWREVDLVALHDRQRRRYTGAFLGLAAFSTAFKLAFGAANLDSEWLRDLVLTAPAVAAALLAFMIKARWSQILAAVIIAAMAAYFLVIASNIEMT